MSPEFVEIKPAQPASRNPRKAASGRKKTEARREPIPNLLRQDAVAMTVLAQDPEIHDRLGTVVTPIPVPAGRLQRGPRSHRFHVVDVNVATSRAVEPVVLHVEGSPWAYVDRWANRTGAESAALASDRAFRAQNVFAIASYTLALFERHLGRRVPWRSGWPHLYLIPEARLGANAYYSPTNSAVFFGWLPAVAGLPAVHTSLSYDVIAHEVAHAILDGLRPRYVEPGLPDQLAFHEALADLVALFSVFGLKGVAQRLLDPDGVGRITFASDAAARALADPAAQKAARLAGRAAFLRRNPLAGLADQLGRAKALRAGTADTGPGSMPLRRSVDLEPGKAWLTDPRYDEAHRRAEVLVAAFMQTFVTMWAGRLEALSTEGGMDAARVAEEGTKSAQHLLGMLLRSLDYLPPVELEFADVIDSVITADRRLAPNDEHHYRDALANVFESYGITAPRHRIIDEDGLVAPGPDQAAERPQAHYLEDPDAPATGQDIRYEHLNFAALRTSAEEVYQFIWNNSGPLGLDVRLSTRVDRVLATTRAGPDGLVLNEVLADYSQLLRTTAGRLPPGMHKPAGMADDAVVEMWGGGVLVFDQFGRFRLHQRKPILDIGRQDLRLARLFAQGLHDQHGGYGTTDGVQADERFALLHPEPSEESF